jgi:hypothetical protein
LHQSFEGKRITISSECFSIIRSTTINIGGGTEIEDECRDFVEAA